MTDTSPRQKHPIPWWVGAAGVAAGLLVSEPALELWVVPDGEIESTVLRVMIFAFDVAAVAFGLRVLVRRPRSRIPWNRLALATASALLTWFLLFTFLDTQAPELLGGTGIRYFDLRSRYAPDSTLVMVPRRTGHEVSYRFRGDLHVPDDDLPDPAIEYRASYNAWGFRSNSGDPPYDLVVFGDSFVEIGETDTTTVSEMLKRATGISTFNLGRGWYGPYHYLQLLERYASRLDPAFAVVFLFEGNDAEDALAYEEWRRGGSYLEFSHAQGALWDRFVTATTDLISFVQWETARHLGVRKWMANILGHDEPLRPSNTGTVKVAGEPLPMKFGYWPHTASPGADRLRSTARWRAVGRALERFVERARAEGIACLVVFVPTKATTYAGQVLEVPKRFRGRDLGDPRDGSVQARAVAMIAEELELAYLDLTPHFRERVGEKPLLYYSQDTHWTPRGRRIAARRIADFMRERWPEATAWRERPGNRSGASVPSRR